jgi:hypothetical protein
MSLGTIARILDVEEYTKTLEALLGEFEGGRKSRFFSRPEAQQSGCGLLSNSKLVLYPNGAILARLYGGNVTSHVYAGDFFRKVLHPYVD